MTPQPGVFENPEEDMYRGWDGEDEDSYVDELVADDRDVRRTNRGYLRNNRSRQDEDEKKNPEIPHNPARKTRGSHWPLKIVHVTRRLAEISNNPDNKEHETINNKAPDENRDAYVYGDDCNEPAYSLVRARCEKRRQGKNAENVLLPIGQESTVNGFRGRSISFLEPTRPGLGKTFRDYA